MRVLLVHNYYGSSAPSGENTVFESEKALLEKHGHEVAVYVRHSDEIRRGGTVRRLYGLAKGALCAVINPFAAHDVAKICRAFKPDVVHVHNTFPLISPLAVWSVGRFAPVVMTLHNYRTFCAAGVPMRKGKVCSLCLDRKCVWNGIRHRCYRGSLLATLPLALNIALYRRVLPRWVKRFLVFSEFQRRRMTAAGFPEEKLSRKPNAIDVQTARTRCADKENQVVYVGRLSSEKGLATLIEAWRLAGRDADCKLILIGDGPGRAAAERAAAGLNAVFLGRQPYHVVRETMARSKAVVLPSECWEGMPMTVLESFAEGTPCIVSDLGALPEMVKGGALGEVFEAGRPEALAEAVKRLLARPDYAEMCRAARREAEARYSQEANFRRLTEIYAAARK